MQGRWQTLAVAVLVALAGCFDTDTGEQDPAPAAPLLDPTLEPIIQSHDHSDPTLHTDHHAMTLVGHTYGYPDEQIPDDVVYGELEIKNGYVYMCRMGAMGGFVTINVSDPTDPRPVGDYEGLGCFDIKSDKTGDLVFWANQRHAIEEAPTVAEGDNYLPRGVQAVDVRDPANPVFAGYFPLPTNGVHTHRYYCYEDEDAEPDGPCEGREVVFLQTYDLMGTPLGWSELATVGGVFTPLYPANPLTHRVAILDLIRNDDGTIVFEILAEIQEFDPTPGVETLAHDSWPERHAVTGDHLLYISYWDLGVVIYDINDPEEPEHVSSFTDFAPSDFANIHFARTHPGLVDEKVVLVAEPELGVAAESGQMTLVDITDPGNPEKLGYWTLPGELVITEPFRFSPHNFGVANERIYMAHQHAGVWVIDMSDPGEPVSAGFYQPHMPRDGFDGDIPRVWSAFFVDGLIWASDSSTGLYVLHYDGDPVPDGITLPEVE